MPVPAIKQLNAPDSLIPAVLVHEFEPGPRFSAHPTVAGGQVIQQLGYKRIKEVAVLWVNDPADIEAQVVLEEGVDGNGVEWVRQGEIQIQFAISEMVGLYNAIVRLVAYTTTNSP